MLPFFDYELFFKNRSFNHQYFRRAQNTPGILSGADLTKRQQPATGWHDIPSLIQIQRLQIFFPFQGQHVLFLIIADLAARDQIIPGAAPAAGQRDQVIHGQFLEGYRLLTIITFTSGGLLLPPAALAHFPGLSPLRPDLVLVHPVKTERVHHLRHQFSQQDLAYSPDQI